MSGPEICQVHDADDVVPGRICGRYLPCKDHSAKPPVDSRVEEVLRMALHAVRNMRRRQMQRAPVLCNITDGLTNVTVYLAPEDCLSMAAGLATHAPRAMISLDLGAPWPHWYHLGGPGTRQRPPLLGVRRVDCVACGGSGVEPKNVGRRAPAFCRECKGTGAQHTCDGTGEPDAEGNCACGLPHAAADIYERMRARKAAR